MEPEFAEFDKEQNKMLKQNLQNLWGKDINLTSSWVQGKPTF